MMRTLDVAALATLVVLHDPLAWKPLAGQSIQYEYESTQALDLRTTARRTYRDGGLLEEHDAEPDVHRELRLRACVVERRIAVESGRPTQIEREYETIVRQDAAGPAGHEDRVSSRHSELESRVVQFKWDAGRGEYRRELVLRRGEGDPEKKLVQLVDRLPEGGEFGFLLPSEPCDEGVEWSVDVACLQQLVPVAGLFPERDLPSVKRPSDEKPSVALNPAYAGGSMPVATVLADPTGTLEATCRGLESRDGVEVAVIELAGNVTGRIDAHPVYRHLFEAGVPPSLPYEYSHVVECDLVVSGELRWDVARGGLHGLTLESELTVRETIRAEVTVSSDADGSATVAGEWDVVWKGSLSSAVRARGADRR